MNHPKVGMRYQDALKNGVRFVKEGSGALSESVTNQVRLHEGEKAAREFVREITIKGNEARGKKYY
jgi:hypothetical protein